MTIDAFGARRFGDGVLYVGMNSADGQCDREARLLKQGAGMQRVAQHGERDPELGADHVRLADRERTIVDLSSADGAHAFAESLGVDDDVRDAIADVLSRALPGSRDELASIAIVFAQGERGGAVPSRLVLSGHCAGDALFDGAGALGYLQFRDVLALARAMPRAAAQVEDVMLSACNSGHAAADPFTVPLTAWREAFPNLKTAWGYAGAKDSHSPTGAVALVHLAAWEHATRGRAERIDAPRAIMSANGGHAAGYEGSVAVWTASQGYVRGK